MCCDRVCAVYVPCAVAVCPVQAGLGHLVLGSGLIVTRSPGFFTFVRPRCMPNAGKCFWEMLFLAAAVGRALPSGHVQRMSTHAFN